MDIRFVSSWLGSIAVLAGLTIAALVGLLVIKVGFQVLDTLFDREREK